MDNRRDEWLTLVVPPGRYGGDTVIYPGFTVVQAATFHQRKTATRSRAPNPAVEERGNYYPDAYISDRNHAPGRIDQAEGGEG